MYSKFRKIISSFAVASLAAGALTYSSAASPRTATHAPAGSEATYHIVVLGDSLAAGYELGFTEHSVPYGFAEHVYEQALFQGYRAEYRNYGILGLKSDGLSKWLGKAAADKEAFADDIQANLMDPRANKLLALTGQLKKDLSEAELILLSVGGNDFLQLFHLMDVKKGFDDLPIKDQEKLKEILASLLDNYGQQLAATLDTIALLQPNAQIVIANQYLPIPFIKTNDKMTYLIPESTAMFFVEAQGQLDNKLNEVITEYTSKDLNIKLADAADAIEKSILSYTSINAGDVHPTRAGYAELGKAFVQPLWGSYKKVAPRKADVPISIVAEGKELMMNYAPLIKKGRTFVAIAEITEAIGAKQIWNAATRTVTIELGDRKVDITIGARTVRINGNKAPLNAEPAYLQQFPGEKKTYVPLAALAEGLGLQVIYRDSIKTVFINR